MRIYALTYYTYDWHEWEEVHAVSFDRALLEDPELRGHYERESELLVVSESEHKRCAESETSHWMIREIPFVEGNPD